MFKNTQKFMAVILSILMVISYFPASAYAIEWDTVSVTDEATDKDMLTADTQEYTDDEIIAAVVEIEALREENVKHFRLADGTYEAIVYAEPVHRKDENGVWQDIDNHLSLQVIGNQQRYSTPDQRVQFSKSVDSGSPLFALTENGYSISLALMSTDGEYTSDIDFSNTSGRSSISREPTIISLQNHSDVGTYDSIDEAASVDNTSVIRYDGVKSNTDIEYVLRGNDIKENIIINAAPEDCEYVFQMNLIGLTAELDASGNIRIKDSETNQPRYIIPAPYMYDANGILSYDVSYELNRISECTYTLKVVADTEWIHATDRAFPVTIDPTISLDEVVFDSYTYLSSPDENFGFSEQLWVSIYRTAYIFMDLPGLPDGATLNSANLYVYFYYYVTEGSLLAGAYQVLESWEESEITYNNAPAIGTTRLSTATLTASESITESTPGRACFSITSAARDWYEDESTNFGIAIKRESSTTATGTSVVLKAFEAHDYYAYISVNYTYYVPDGVYALKNAYSSNRWMTVEDDSPWQGNHIQQVHSASSPADASVFDRSSLFKISRVPGTSRYIIRSMVNNSISFGISGTEIITKDIPSADSDVAYADTFFIEWDGYGFLIRPYGSSYVINMSSTSTSNLTTIAKSSATSKARWRLVQYTGASRYGSAVYRTTDMNAGTTAIFTPVVWSTKTDWNTAEMTVAPGYYNYATSTWNESTRQGFFALHDNGIFYAFLHIYNGDKTSSYTSTYTFTVTLVVDEGVYFIKNKDVGKYMQIDNNKAPSYTQSGAIMELRSFDGGDYQKWNLTHVVDGYYKIVSVKSGLSLSVQSSHLNDDEYALVQEAYASLSRQLWKITESSSGAYVIRPKSGESYDTDWCMRAGFHLPLISTNGLNVEQRAYVNDSNYDDEWVLEPYSVVLYGITNSGHDHISCLNTIASELMGSNWNDVLVRGGAVSSSTCKNDLLSCNIFTSRSHGGVVLYAGTNQGVATGILLNDESDDSSQVVFYSHSWNGMNSGSDSMNSNEDYSNIDIALFIGCETAYGDKGQKNLPSAIVEYGATAAVGFKGDIDCVAANTWTVDFYTKMLEGVTLEEAVNFACQKAPVGSGLETAVICGDGTVVFP